MTLRENPDFGDRWKRISSFHLFIILGISVNKAYFEDIIWLEQHSWITPKIDLNFYFFSKRWDDDYDPTHDKYVGGQVCEERA